MYQLQMRLGLIFLPRHHHPMSTFWSVVYLTLYCIVLNLRGTRPPSADDAPNIKTKVPQKSKRPASRISFALTPNSSPRNSFRLLSTHCLLVFVPERRFLCPGGAFHPSCGGHGAIRGTRESTYLSRWRRIHVKECRKCLDMESSEFRMAYSHTGSPWGLHQAKTCMNMYHRKIRPEVRLTLRTGLISQLTIRAKLQSV